MRKYLYAIACAALFLAFTSPEGIHAQILSAGGPTPYSGLPMTAPTAIYEVGGNNSFGITYTPDMHTPILKEGSFYYLYISGRQQNDNFDGTMTVLKTASLSGQPVFSAPVNDGAGNALPVMQPTCHKEGFGATTPPTPCATNFDSDYTGLNGVWTAVNGTDLFGEDHCETRAFGSGGNLVINAHTPFYAAVCRTKLPGGVAAPTGTWGANSEIITSNDPPPASGANAPSSAANGAVEGTTIVDASGTYLLTVYADFPVNCCSYADAGNGPHLELARAPKSPNDGAPGEWCKLYLGSYTCTGTGGPGGTYTNAGLGGVGDDVFAGNTGGCVNPRQPFITYSSNKSEYVMLMLCSKGWWYSTSTNETTWTTPTKFYFPGQTPIFASCIPADENFVMMTPGNADDQTIGASGIYLWAHTGSWSCAGNGVQPHVMYRAGFTF